MPGDVRMSGGPLESGVISRGWPEDREALADAGDDFVGALEEDEGGVVAGAAVGVMAGGDELAVLGREIGGLGAGAVAPADDRGGAVGGQGGRRQCRGERLVNRG